MLSCTALCGSKAPAAGLGPRPCLQALVLEPESAAARLAIEQAASQLRCRQVAAKFTQANSLQTDLGEGGSAGGGGGKHGTQAQGTGRHWG